MHLTTEIEFGNSDFMNYVLVILECMFSLLIENSFSFFFSFETLLRFVVEIICLSELFHETSYKVSFIQTIFDKLD